jgi:hypothetical protein
VIFNAVYLNDKCQIIYLVLFCRAIDAISPLQQKYMFRCSQLLERLRRVFFRLCHYSSPDFPFHLLEDQPGCQSYYWLEPVVTFAPWFFFYKNYTRNWISDGRRNRLLSRRTIGNRKKKDEKRNICLMIEF